ncbi:uncharacterized protein C8A04DRAFT_24190 [Dichotomopilus funicola]|uniref:Uncharacterized protein n=1 Tax=Dichotomopilus funicola TaxID=1934379 RepID=A0AAN6VA14_9PEZI|nr:hypothetical protein C8A04DRAFT_24190 [Dichotomopilus funicola]
MPSTAAITIYIFGASALYQGASILLAPRQALATRQLPESARPALTAFGVAISGLGAYYTLAAYQENRTFFALTLFRIPAAIILGAQGPGWRPMAAWEVLATLATAASLAWEGWA